MRSYIRNLLLFGVYLFAFIMGYSGGTYVYSYLAESQFVIATWKSDPVIVICDNSRITESRMTIAGNFWKEKGYTYAFFQKDDTGEICKNKYLDGFILISHGRVKEPTLARTKRITIMGEIRSARVIIPNNRSHHANLLEHELGHAFGFGHIDDPGHIMNPSYEYMGKKFYIP